MSRDKRIIKAKTGKPVKISKHLGFLPSKEAQREHATMFNDQHGMARLIANALRGDK